MDSEEKKQKLSRRSEWTSLHLAAMAGNENAVKALLAKEEININEKAERGFTPLHFAVVSGKTEILKALLTKEGTNVNEKDDRGYAPLHLAVVNGKTETVEVLLKAGQIDVNIQDKSGRTPLDLVFRNRQADVENLLIKKGGMRQAYLTTQQWVKNAQPALKCFTDLSSKVKKEDFKKIVYKMHLINKDGLNTQIEKKIDEIIKKGYEDYSEMCSFMKEKGYYVYNEDEKGFKAFQYPELVGCRLSKRNSSYSLRLLPPKGHDMPYFNGYIDHSSQKVCTRITLSDNTQLMFDISNSSAENIGSLIEQTRDINRYSLRYGNNPILLAISKGWNHISGQNEIYEYAVVEIKEKLRSFHDLKSARDLTKEEINHSKKVEDALNAYKKRLNEPPAKQKDIIDTLLKRKDLDINCIELKFGMTPLHIACLRGDSPELIQKLLERGANPNAVNYEDKKPIDLLSLECDEAKKFLELVTGWKFGINDIGRPISKNRSATVTLPTEEERENNIREIEKLLLLAANKSCTGVSVSNGFRSQENLGHSSHPDTKQNLEEKKDDKNVFNNIENSEFKSNDGSTQHSDEEIKKVSEGLTGVSVQGSSKIGGQSKIKG